MISFICGILKKPNSQKRRVGQRLPGAGEWGDLGRCGSQGTNLQLEDEQAL